MEAEWKHRPSEGQKVAVNLKNVWKKRIITPRAEMHMCNVIEVPSALSGNKTNFVKAGLRKKVNVLEMSYMRPLRGVTVRNRMRSKDILEQDAVRNTG